ncbi:hypothetical protein QTP88_007085 [Uroleucon formosanum]
MPMSRNDGVAAFDVGCDTKRRGFNTSRPTRSRGVGRTKNHVDAGKHKGKSHGEGRTDDDKTCTKRVERGSGARSKKKYKYGGITATKHRIQLAKSIRLIRRPFSDHLPRRLENDEKYGGGYRWRRLDYREPVPTPEVQSSTLR